MFHVSDERGSAEARPSSVTKVKYYAIAGSTARDLDYQMTTRGPIHGRGRAYANLVVKPDYAGQLVQGRSCTVKNFTISAEFIMTLPTLAPGTRLPAGLKSQWASFQAFAKKHEEGHKAIWLDSMGKAQRRIEALNAPGCGELDRRIEQVFDEEWRKSERRQDAYDLAEQKKLARHPLIVAATRVPRAKAQAITASRPAVYSRAVRLHRWGNR
jgi:predicted secreted Zn-dependent protease